jgi:hypothetical protein
MTLREHNQRQIDAALAPENRWYCSEFYGREITDHDALLEYFIKHGGAEFFGQPRFACKPANANHVFLRAE